MPGGDAARVLAQRSPAAPLPGDAEGIAEQGLCRHRAQADDNPRLHPIEFGGQPLPAGGLLGGVGALVQARLAAWLVLEMLDGVGEVERLAIQPRLGHGAVQQAAGGTNKRLAGEILLRARLLADQHRRRVRRATPEHRLGGAAP